MSQEKIGERVKGQGVKEMKGHCLEERLLCGLYCSQDLCDFP
jgi:hypothetical protein